jgi:hypothetical protein
VNLYFGTTAEPRQNLAPSWHVERDVTDYSALFTNPQSGSVILGNIVNSTYTGIISGSAALEFYPADEHGSSRRVADAGTTKWEPIGSTYVGRSLDVRLPSIRSIHRW